MTDQSHLDRKYFIDDTVYNCPYCNRGNVSYENWDYFTFNWTNDKSCCVYLIRCKSCNKISMHLSYEEIHDKQYIGDGYRTKTQFKEGIDIDSKMFYSVPTSFFVLDNRIPGVIRELITEAEGCLKMNYLTGASACMRKAVYELLIHEKATGEDYGDRIKSLKKMHPETDASLFDILSSIKGMTSEKVHEQSWDEWNSATLQFIIETLKTVLHDIYVIPQIKKERYVKIQQLSEKIYKDKKGI